MYYPPHPFNHPTLVNTDHGKLLAQIVMNDALIYIPLARKAMLSMSQIIKTYEGSIDVSIKKFKKIFNLKI